MPQSKRYTSTQRSTKQTAAYVIAVPSGASFPSFESVLTGRTGERERGTPRGGEVISFRLRQTHAVSDPSAQLADLIAHVTEDLVRAEAIRRHREWVAAWFDPRNIVAETGELVAALGALFSDHPLEEGFTHPVEELLDTWLRRFPSTGVAVLADLLGDMSFAYRVELLGGLGRLPYDKVQGYAARILRVALRSESVVLRDAAVRAYELWGEPSLASILRDHREPTPWLAEYIRKLVAHVARR